LIRLALQLVLGLLLALGFLGLLLFIVIFLLELLVLLVLVLLLRLFQLLALLLLLLGVVARLGNLDEVGPFGAADVGPGIVAVVGRLQPVFDLVARLDADRPALLVLQLRQFDEIFVIQFAWEGAVVKAEQRLPGLFLVVAVGLGLEPDAALELHA